MPTSGPLDAPSDSWAGADRRQTEAEKVVGQDHQDRMLAQAVQVDEAISALPDELKGTSVYFQVDIHPLHQAPSKFPHRLLAACGGISAGSRSCTSALSDGRHVETSSVVVAGPPDCASRLADLISAGPQDRRSRAALRQLQVIGGARMPTSVEILGKRLPNGAWESALHPQPAPDGDYCTPSSDETVEKWGAWVKSLGGEVLSEWVRCVGMLTYVPVRLHPVAVERVVSFNPLRFMRPTAPVGPRSG